MKRRTTIVAASAAVVAVLGLSAWWSAGWAQFTDAVTPRTADLSKPDALLVTRSLASLPRDALKLPLAQDLLTEDFLFHYTSHPDVLGVEGAVRRIAYEHALDWNDQLVKWVLERPAQVALWRDGKGALRHWALATERKSLAGVFDAAATIAAADGQLFAAGEIASDGGAIALHALTLRTGRTLLLATRADRVVVFSEPGLLLGADRKPRAGADAFVRKLLTRAADAPTAWQQAFRVEETSAGHSLLLRAGTLAFGYQRFFPSLDAVRLDFGDGKWSTQLLTNASAAGAALVADRRLWEAAPIQAAACTQLPVNWAAGAAVVKRAKAGKVKALAPVAAHFDGPLLACWYAEGGLLAPLFVAALADDGPADDAAVGALVDWALAGESVIAKGTDTAIDGGHRWQHRVVVPHAGRDEQGVSRPGATLVTVARQGRYVLFSPDAQRVTAAIDTLARRYPSLATTLPESGPMVAVVTPSAIAALARDEILKMLPADQEPVLRPVADRTLLPRLAALGRHPPHRAVLDAAPTGRTWQVLDWQALPQ